MTRSNSRRRFLRQTTASLMGLVAGGFWTSTAAIASRSALEKLRLGAIGVGNRGEANITALKSEDWVALCDVDRRFLDQMHDRYPAAKTYRDFRELLDHRDLDAVVVSSPDHTHYHAARPALQRKLHVYCEKPLAHSVAEAHQLAEAARQANVVAQMGNQHHSSEGYRQVVALLRAEALGRVSEVHSWSNRPLWPQGISRPPAGGPAPEYLDWNLWLGPAPTRPYHESYHPFNWRGWWDFGTGALGDMGPHLLDPAFAGLDLTEPEHVEAETSEVDAEASDDHKPESAPKASVVRFRFPLAAHDPP